MCDTKSQDHRLQPHELQNQERQEQRASLTPSNTTTSSVAKQCSCVLTHCCTLVLQHRGNTPAHNHIRHEDCNSVQVPSCPACFPAQCFALVLLCISLAMKAARLNQSFQTINTCCHQLLPPAERTQHS
jgi:hypothetical protein